MTLLPQTPKYSEDYLAEHRFLSDSYFCLYFFSVFCFVSGCLLTSEKNSDDVSGLACHHYVFLEHNLAEDSFSEVLASRKN